MRMNDIWTFFYQNPAYKYEEGYQFFQKLDFAWDSVQPGITVLIDSHFRRILIDVIVGD